MLVCIHCGISYATYEKYPISCAKGEETYQHEFSPKEEFSKKCKICGCTDLEACINQETGEKCYWVQEEVCSSCGPLATIDRIINEDEEIFNELLEKDGDSVGKKDFPKEAYSKQLEEEFSKKCPGCGKEFKTASMDLADYMVGSHNATECEVGF